MSNQPEQNKNRQLALVFTQGVGLGSWLEAGYASREIEYYRDLSAAFGGVTFITYDKRNPSGIPGLPALRPIEVRYNSWRLDRRLFSLVAAFQKFRSLRHVDVIKTSQHRGSWAALLLKWVLRKPMVARCGYVWSLFEQRSGACGRRMRLVKALEGFVLKRADVVLVPDQFAVDYLSSVHNIPTEKFAVNPNFVDTDQFTPKPIENRSKNLFLFVGRLENVQKRPHLAIDGAELTSGAKLEMIGDGPDADSVRARVDQLENVYLFDRLPHDEIATKMSDARALIITSSFEGNPKVVIEALAAGLPVISTKSQGLVEIVEDRVNGLLVEPDGGSIAEAMNELMGDADLWNTLSDNARDLALDYYSRSKVLEREVALLNNLVDAQ